jgi:two-component system, NtrC family, sensor histidine kinase HydH
MLKKLFPDASLLTSDVAAFKRQESIFIGLNLSLLAVLLFLHWRFTSFWGNPSQSLVIATVSVFFLKCLELIWVHRLKQPLQPIPLLVLTWTSILINLGLAMLLAALTDHEDSPYFVLMAVPILEAAFRLDLSSVLTVITVADLSLVFEVWRYFEKHPPLEIGEYFEAGTTSLMLAIVGIVVWRLVRDLRQQETRLANNVLELEQTRERLLQEERLAAVGRFSSAIAHEIRNPVAMISSSIATAKQLSGAEREEMFEIASAEAARLVTLTTEFLDYARPRTPSLEPTSLADTIHYITDASRAHARQKGLQIEVKVSDLLEVEADPGQLQQALMDLVLNAVDAAPANTLITLTAQRTDHRVCIDVENSGDPIPEPAVERIFEPFFTTKTQGTGLGLAIARNIARAHGGDLAMTMNGPQRICFSMILPMRNGTAKKE